MAEGRKKQEAHLVNAVRTLQWHLGARGSGPGKRLRQVFASMRLELKRQTEKEHRSENAMATAVNHANSLKSEASERGQRGKLAPIEMDTSSSWWRPGSQRQRRLTQRIW